MTKKTILEILQNENIPDDAKIYIQGFDKDLFCTISGVVSRLGLKRPMAIPMIQLRFMESLKMKQLTKEQAIAFGKSKAYEGMSFRMIAKFQLSQRKLCMPFNVFHKAVEEALGRPVYTHEFVNPELLLKELIGDMPTPTLEEIIKQIPAEKLVLINL